MKISNWRRKLAATLLAGGLITPAAAYAAELDVNLVVNGGFENVDLEFTSYYNAPNILDWTSLFPGFAYSHDASGVSVPDFANGGPLASGGHWYFTPGNGGNDSESNALTQIIDVSSGPSAAAIGSGSAQFNLSAFFSTYATQADRGFVKADFLDSSDESLSSALVATPEGSALPTWTEFETSGTIPAGTQKIRMSSWGEVFTGSAGSADGYTDNVSLVISDSATSATADFDSDGDIDGADFLIWQRGFGIASGATRLQGNSNPSVDGAVDGADFSQWKSQLGDVEMAAAAGIAAPEPAGALLAGAGLLAVSAQRKRR